MSKYVNTIRAWLVLFRAHTAVLEAPIAVLGASVALGSFWNIEVLKWASFGILFHFCGYGMNSYVDWKKGYDKDDPHKSHHPLNTGDLSPEQASYAVKACLLILIVYGVYLTNLKPIPLVVLAIMILSGVGYNYIGKVTQHKYLLVATVHTSIFLLAYTSYSSTIPNILWIVVLAYFVHHTFQILISGDVKDVAQDESSLVQEIGMGISEDNGKEILEVEPRVIAVSYLIAILESLLVIGVLLFFKPSIYTVLVTVLMMGWMLLEVDDIIHEGVYNRQQRVAAMSRKELAGLWMIFAAFSGTIGIEAWLAMVIISIAYFVPVSLFMWGSMTPDV